MQTGYYQIIPEDKRLLFNLTFTIRIFPVNQLVPEIHHHFCISFILTVNLYLHRMPRLLRYFCVLNFATDLFLVSTPNDEQLSGEVLVGLVSHEKDLLDRVFRFNFEELKPPVDEKA
jgi:hypothetical protein